MSNEEPLLSDMDVGESEPPASPTDYQTIPRRHLTPAQDRPPGGAGVGAEAPPVARRPNEVAVNATYEDNSKNNSPEQKTGCVPDVGVRQPGKLPKREGPVGATTPVSPGSSETHLLVPEENGEGPLKVTLMDPDEAGNVILWNGNRCNISDFIKKVSKKTQTARSVKKRHNTKELKYVRFAIENPTIAGTSLRTQYILPHVSCSFLYSLCNGNGG